MAAEKREQLQMLALVRNIELTAGYQNFTCRGYVVLALLQAYFGVVLAVTIEISRRVGCYDHRHPKQIFGGWKSGQ